MEKEFDQTEFENYLTDEFFNGNEENEIARLIKQQLTDDEDFKKQYSKWIEESSYESWNDYYQFLQDEEDLAWNIMFSDRD